MISGTALRPRGFEKFLGDSLMLSKTMPFPVYIIYIYSHTGLHRRSTSTTETRRLIISVHAPGVTKNKKNCFPCCCCDLVATAAAASQTPVPHRISTAGPWLAPGHDRATRDKSSLSPTSPAVQLRATDDLGLQEIFFPVQATWPSSSLSVGCGCVRLFALETWDLKY